MRRATSEARVCLLNPSAERARLRAAARARTWPAPVGSIIWKTANMVEPSCGARGCAARRRASSERAAASAAWRARSAARSSSSCLPRLAISSGKSSASASRSRTATCANHSKGHETRGEKLRQSSAEACEHRAHLWRILALLRRAAGRALLLHRQAARDTVAVEAVAAAQAARVRQHVQAHRAGELGEVLGRTCGRHRSPNGPRSGGAPMGRKRMPVPERERSTAARPRLRHYAGIWRCSPAHC